MESKVRKQYREERANNDDYHFDLRQEECWNYYIDPQSPTFNNAMRSAMRAGYAESTARTIAQEPWFCKRRETFTKMMPKVEENLMETLNLETKFPVEVNGKIVYKHDASLLRIKHDSTTFVAETLGKNRFSKKLTLQHTGKVSLLNESLDQVFDEEESD